MAKAVTEVALGAAAIAAPFVLPGMGIAVSAAVMHGLIAAGASMAFSGAMEGISSVLNKNQGGLAVGVSTPVGPWGYIYGTQKVGGVEIFRQSNNSGGVSNDKSLHRVYVLACHPCVVDGGNFQLRIDGRQVQVEASIEGDGYGGFQSVSPAQFSQAITSMVRDSNGLVTLQLGGLISGDSINGTTVQIKNSSDPTMNGNYIVTQPDPQNDTLFTFISGGTPGSATGGILTTLYADYKDKIFIQFLNGRHTSTFPRLLVAGTNWTATDLCLGRTLVYVRMGYDESVFPSSIPNVSFVINGKNDILDPRTGQRGYTNNAALCIADFMSLPSIKGGFGLTVGSDIPSDQLIAAANICDEQVALAGGGHVARYTCDTYFMLNQGRGAILQQLLSSCAGRLSYQGGQFSIFPGAWVTPTLQLSDADIVGGFSFKPRLSIRETCNAVKGTYVSVENNYQQGDFPPYMQNAAHGFVADPWLAEDGGERIFKEINLSCTSSSATAQRLAKIEMMRSRFQIRGTIRCSMKAYQAVALDVIQLTHPRYTWLNKNFEVLASRFVQEKQGDVPVIAVELDLAETDSSIYDWTIAEQLTPQGYAQPDNVGNSVCPAPDDVVTYSGPGATVNGIVFPSTIARASDSSLQVSLYVHWILPYYADVIHGGHAEVQYKQAGTLGWTAWGRVDPSVTGCFINGVSSGASYLVQVRYVNCAGVPSAWTQASPSEGGSAWSVAYYSGVAVLPAGSIRGFALPDDTADVSFPASFTPFYGKFCTLASTKISGLRQGSTYFFYYVDQYFRGGSVTAVATQSPSDYLMKDGYFFLGSVVTPRSGPSYSPSAYQDLGDMTTANPERAYDGNRETFAAISAMVYNGRPYAGNVTFNGFPPVTLSSDVTLSITVAAIWSSSPASSSFNILPYVEMTSLAAWSNSGTLAKTTYTVTIPAGTDLSKVGIHFGAAAFDEMELDVYEISIQ